MYACVSPAHASKRVISPAQEMCVSRLRRVSRQRHRGTEGDGEHQGCGSAAPSGSCFFAFFRPFFRVFR